MLRADPAGKHRHGLLAALGAMLIQGSWAVFANRAHGCQASLLAGAVQGASSFCMTFAVTLFIEYLLIFFSQARPVLRSIATAMVAIIGMLAMQTGAHWVAGTPEILLTIAPAAGIGSIYCILYSSGRIFLGKSSKSPLFNQWTHHEKNSRTHQRSATRTGQ